MQNEFPPLPSVQPIPKATVEQWVELPTEADVEVSLTRQDIDNFFFAISHLASSVGGLQETLVAYSNGDTENANKSLDASRRTSIESINALRALMTSLMASALRNRAAKKDG